MKGTNHHVLGIEHLLREFWNGQSTVLLRATRCERSETNHEEVQTRERDQVDSELAQIAVELAREPQTAGGAGHRSRDQMVQVAIGGGRELQGPEADVVEGLVVNHHNLIGILNKLMDGQSSIVRLD